MIGVTREGSPVWEGRSEQKAVVGTGSLVGDTAASTVAAGDRLAGTAADMAVVAIAGVESGRTEVSAVHEVLDTEDMIAGHRDLQTLAVSGHAAAVYVAGRRTWSRLGDLASDA